MRGREGGEKRGRRDGEAKRKGGKVCGSRDEKIKMLNKGGKKKSKRERRVVGKGKIREE